MSKEIQKRVCVTGGTGFLGSWMIKRLLEDGYSVNATVRLDPERKRDISYITNLPGAAERLRIFNADLDRPETFAPAIQGCSGVFHMAHPLDFAETEAEEVKVRRVTAGLQGILQACAASETVRRVVYTSSISTAAFSGNDGVIDESMWTDVEVIRSLKVLGGHYIVTKTLAEKTAIDIAEKLGLDLVSVLPTWITGPFICPNVPDSVQVSMALILENEAHYKLMNDSSLVHVDDVARAHIHVMEHPEARGRYLVGRDEFKIEELSQFLSKRYPHYYKMPSPDSWKDVKRAKFSGLSRKKLEAIGFKYENGLEEMFDGAIKSCKEKGFTSLHIKVIRDAEDGSNVIILCQILSYL